MVQGISMQCYCFISSIATHFIRKLYSTDRITGAQKMKISTLSIKGSVINDSTLFDGSVCVKGSLFLTVTLSSFHRKYVDDWVGIDLLKGRLKECVDYSESNLKILYLPDHSDSVNIMPLDDSNSFYEKFIMMRIWWRLKPIAQHKTKEKVLFLQIILNFQNVLLWNPWNRFWCYILL